MKTKSLIILIIVLVLAGLVLGFIYWLQSVKPEAEVSRPEKETEDLCAQFPKVEGEVSCREAREIALEKHPGQIMSIEKTTTSYQSGKPYNKEPLKIKTEQREVWIVKIYLKESFLPPSLVRISPPLEEGEGEYQYSTEKVGVVVDRYQKEILFFQSIP